MERLSTKRVEFSCLFKSIFKYTQVFGFSPFAYDTVKGKVIPSKLWFLYSNLFTITLIALTVCYLHFNSELLLINKKFNIFFVVKASDIYANCLIMLISYIIQIYNQNELIDTINLAIVIRKNLRYLSPNQPIFSKSFWEHSRRVSLILLIQGIVFTWYCFESWRKVTTSNTYFQFVLMNYYHLGISIIVVKIFYHSGMTIGIRLYEMMNDRISEIIGNVTEQEREMMKSGKFLFVTGVDQCDHLILIFVKITHFINSVNKLFSTQIICVIVGCFMCILSSVSIK